VLWVWEAWPLQEGVLAPNREEKGPTEGVQAPGTHTSATKTIKVQDLLEYLQHKAGGVGQVAMATGPGRPVPAPRTPS